MKLSPPPLLNDPGIRDSADTIEPSESRFRAILLALIAIIGPPLLLFAYDKTMYHGLTNPDAMDFAQLGRNIASGHGFITYILRPLALSPTYGANPSHMPDVTHGPLYPLLLAIAFGALGAKSGVAALISGIFYLLTLPVLYQLGKRMFNPAIGRYAVCVYLFNALMLEYAASGLHITLYIFLSTSLFLTIYTLAASERSSEALQSGRLSRGPLLLSGVLVGSLYLTDPIFFWFIPAVLGCILWICGNRRLPSALWFLTPLLILTMPWMARNWMLTGNPFFGLRGEEIMMNTSIYPGFIAYRYTPDGFNLGVGLFQAVIKKFLLSSGQVIQIFPQVTASWVLAFFLPCLFFRFRDHAANAVRTTVMYCFFGVFFGTVLFTLQMPIFVSTIPTMFVFSIAYLAHLIRDAHLERRAVIRVGILVTVVALWPLLSAVFLADKPGRVVEAESAKVLGQDKVIRRGGVILSDEPWIVAWYANRPSIWLPANNLNIENFKNRFTGKITGLLLTERAPNLSPEWESAYGLLKQLNLATYSPDQLNPGENENPVALKGVKINNGLIPKNAPPSLRQLLMELDGIVLISPTNLNAINTIVGFTPGA